ncbi:hypothetical protein BU15DRAFT_57156 [Melanogaster broomeanus]|nr:hypothetical protein BU15DRAFT_57156 [Melanogaster broomeanus]
MRLFPEPAPHLPRFRNLLMYGPYHPSAPIHLCLSMAPADKAILLTPSRPLFLDGLRKYNDQWLKSYSGTGSMASISSRVNIFYPPSPKHLVAMLSMFRIHEVSASVPVDPKATIDVAPALLILHEPSAYFLSQEEDDPSSPTSVVVFDSKLDQLKFPVLRALPRSTLDEPDGPDDVPRPESVLFFVQKYFELWGTFQSLCGLYCCS